MWFIGAADSGHFAPSASPFMVNDLVADLASLLQALRNVLDMMDDSEYGKFGWVMSASNGVVVVGRSA